jgi:hypothetical protein
MNFSSIFDIIQEQPAKNKLWTSKGSKLNILNISK